MRGPTRGHIKCCTQSICLSVRLSAHLSHALGLLEIRSRSNFELQLQKWQLKVYACTRLLYGLREKNVEYAMVRVV